MTKVVLLLEQDQAQIDQLDRLLGSYGVELEVLESGLAGLEHARQRVPDLVVASLELEDINGFTLCKRFRKEEALKGVPFFLLSSGAERSALESHSRLRSAANAYLMKPFCAETFWRRAAPWLAPGSGVEVTPAAEVVEAGARVLVVDSDQASVEKLRPGLSLFGCQVEVVESGAEAMRQAQSHRPDAMIVCAELADGSGFALCRKLRRDSVLGEVPLFLMSARATPDIFAQHSKLRSGADAYFLKPFEAADVLGEVATFLPVPR